MRFSAVERIFIIEMFGEQPLPIRVNGSQFLAQMPKEVKSVLCTGHREFGVDSYEYDCCDYLLKPFDFRRFMAAIERVKFDLGIADRSGTANKGDAYYFLVKGEVRNKRTLVAFNEIIYIETINNFSNFYQVGQSQPLQTKHRLKEVIEVLPAEKFLRIGRSYVVNIDFFKSYKPRKVSVKGVNHLLDVGERENYPEFYQWMERNTLEEKNKWKYKIVLSRVEEVWLRLFSENKTELIHWIAINKLLI